MEHLPLAFALAATVAAIALRRTRWAIASLWISRIAYGLLILQVPVYFLAGHGFRHLPPVCEWTFSLALARHSLTNYAHIVLFVVFFLLSYAQLRGVRARLLWSVGATLALGLMLELAQGVSGNGHCRMRDLIPDCVGALTGVAIVAAGSKLLKCRSGRRSSFREHS